MGSNRHSTERHSLESNTDDVDRLESFEIDDTEVDKEFLNHRHSNQTTHSEQHSDKLLNEEEEDDDDDKEVEIVKKKCKFEITIPRPTKQEVTLGDKVIGYIMSGGKNVSGGLTGKPLLYFTSVFVSLGVFLFGYDQGVMSCIITGPYFKDYFNQPTRAQLGTMVAILEIGALISSLIVGRLGDIIGRRKTIFYGALIFVVGGSLQSFCSTFGIMVLGRIVSGFGVGMLSTIVPIYQSEISPPHNRGKLACIEFTGNVVGYASSVWVDYFCSFIQSDVSWRLPLFLQCVMGTLLLLGSLIIVETPRWLLDNDYDEEGMLVIANLHGRGDVNNPAARQEFRDIKEGVLIQRQEGERSYPEMWRKYKKRVLIAMSSQAFAQLNGINVISYYAPLVFEEAGWVGRDAILMTGINSIIYVMSTIPPWYLVDRWGRRLILLSGAITMAFALSSISYFMYLDIPQTPTLVVIFVVIFNAFFGYSWGPIPWLYPPEIMPLSIRAKGASLSTASNWAFNWLVGEMTPILQQSIEWRLYLMHAFFCVCSFVVVYFTYPETKGVHLEDMDSLFGDKSIVSSVPGGLFDTQSLLSNNNNSNNNYGEDGDIDEESRLFIGSSATSQPSAAAVARSQRSHSTLRAPGVGSPRFGPAVITSHNPTTLTTTQTTNQSLSNYIWSFLSGRTETDKSDVESGSSYAPLKDSD